MADGRRRGSTTTDRLVEAGGVQVIVPEWPGIHPRLRAAVSTRVGGVSPGSFGLNTSFRVGDAEASVRTNRGLFLAAAGVPADSLATAGQVHGSRVVVVDRPGHHPECDGLVTDRPGLYLGVSIADCIPVLLFDRNREVVAAVHSGWRGSRERIAGRCLALMAERFGTRPGDVEAFIGPSAGACCYEVGGEVAGHFPAEFLKPSEGGKFLLDLGTFNRNLLVAAGVPSGQVVISGRCTIHESSTFHSHRRDRERSGRMLAVVGIDENVAS